MDMDTELQTIRTNGNEGAANGQELEDVPDGGACRPSTAPENCRLLHEQVTGRNGEVMPSGHAAETQRNVGNAGETNSVYRLKKDLNEVIFWKVRLWMVMIFFIFIIITVIIMSLIVCSVFHEDVDEKFDSSLFKVPRYFSGSFQLPKIVFTEELFNISSKESQELVFDIKEKLAGLFNSSPALGRYYSKAEIKAFRNGSVIADYKLMFLMPDEEQVKQFTLSKQVVYSVFKQFLYDQDPDQSGVIYIDPVSLSMKI